MSAKIEGLVRPPLASSPFERVRYLPRLMSWAVWERFWVQTTRLLRLVSLPSGKSGNMVNRVSEVQSSRTASPRNSYLSLDLTPLPLFSFRKDRWMRAWQRYSSFLNLMPNFFWSCFTFGSILTVFYNI